MWTHIHVTRLGSKCIIMYQSTFISPCLELYTWTNTHMQSPILYSGQTDHKHRDRVAVSVTRKVKQSLLDWKPISDRLTKLDLILTLLN